MEHPFRRNSYPSFLTHSSRDAKQAGDWVWAYKAWRVMQLHHGDITVSNLADGVATRLQFVKSP